ncbi:hypothetical protein Y030_2754 [Burkholderia pseudomallei MSHR332]|nr:hypothetical protein Y030_2754 [Burkholderia pseudomallei MSHR332]
MSARRCLNYSRINIRAVGQTSATTPASSLHARPHHAESRFCRSLQTGRLRTDPFRDLPQHRAPMERADLPARQLPQLLHATQQPVHGDRAACGPMARHQAAVATIRIRARRRRAVHGDHRHRLRAAARASGRGASCDALLYELDIASSHTDRGVSRLAVRRAARADRLVAARAVAGVSGRIPRLYARARRADRLVSLSVRRSARARLSDGRRVQRRDRGGQHRLRRADRAARQPNRRARAAGRARFDGGGAARAGAGRLGTAT